MDLSVTEFLKALQLHCHDFGMFSECISDLGSSLQAGANSMRAFLSDHETQRFLGTHGIREISFSLYSKGNSSLGSLVETLVKQVKHLIWKSVKTNVLDFFYFQFLISEANNLINKRPVGFKEELHAMAQDELPFCITPEMLIRGVDCPTLNIIPQLQSVEAEFEPGQGNDLSSAYEKLKRVREKMIDVYHRDFMVNLISQATDKPDRYLPVKHKTVRVGDVVLLVEPHQKQYKYPMGRVVSVEQNDLGETTAARILKGCSHETVYRHVTSIIPLLSPETEIEPTESLVFTEEPSSETITTPNIRRTKRQAAKMAMHKIKNIGPE